MSCETQIAEPKHPRLTIVPTDLNPWVAIWKTPPVYHHTSDDSAETGLFVEAVSEVGDVMSGSPDNCRLMMLTIATKPQPTHFDSVARLHYGAGSNDSLA